MADQLETIAGTGTAPLTSDREAQRAALSDLVALSAQCAQLEAEEDRRHRDAIEAAAKRRAAAEEAACKRHAGEEQTAHQSHEQRVGELQADFDSKSSSLREEVEVALRRADQEARVTQANVKSEYEQAVWLAESVYDGTEIQLATELKKAQEKVAEHELALEDLERQIGDVLFQYRMEFPEQPGEDPPTPSTNQSFTADRENIESQIHRMASLQVPRMFVGARPVLLLAVIVILAAVGGQVGVQLITGSSNLRIDVIGIAAGAALVICLLGGWALRILSRKHVAAVYGPLMNSVTASHALGRHRLKHAERERTEKLAAAVLRRDAEIKAAKDGYAPLFANASKQRDVALQTLRGKFDQHSAQFGAQRENALTSFLQERDHHLSAGQGTLDAEQRAAQHAHESDLAAEETLHRQTEADLEKRWNDGLKQIQSPTAGQKESGAAPARWDDPAWTDWIPPKSFAAKVPFGELQVDLRQISEHVPQRLKLPEKFSVPAFLAFPRQASLLLQSDRAGREQAVRTLQMVMLRLLTNLPAGRVKFTILDPVGLGESFAGFMHLADYDESLVGGRIWTSAEQIDQRLADLTEHMETVIQKYLRNEFETIDEYNQQAGELAEPYRFLVIADLPTNFSSESMRRLASISTSGARCGVYTIISRDARQPLPGGSHMEEVEANSVNLVWREGRFVWADEVFQRFPLVLDAPPNDVKLNEILHVVGKHAKDANRVEVPFSSIAPSERELWSLKCDSEIRIPIGRLGATRLQSMKLGRGVAQHMLIAGKTGSGKSTLLHALVTNAAMWYSPDEVEFYLVDFKKGVEFKTYATHELPHARAIAVESDREFGLSVLQRIDAELARRGELYRKAGVQDLATYRRETGLVLPRTLLIIDEFQEFFSEDDKLGQDSAVLLDRLVRQGRAFGVHVLLGSQTIAGSSGLSRSTIGQMAVRVALQTSEADSQLILGDNNGAARLLSRPGEAIYNDQGGLLEGNSPFQIAWLPDEQRDVYLDRVHAQANHLNGRRARPIVFEGNAPADLAQNIPLAELLAAPAYPPRPTTTTAWLGDPVAIKAPTAATFRRQSGSNVLLVGQQDDAALAITVSSVLSLAARQSARDARFVLFDGSPADSPLATVLPQLKTALPHDIQLVEWRRVNDALNDLAAELTRRQADDSATPEPSIYVMFYGLQRYRMLRKQEESFSFSADGAEKPADPSKQFADLLREGPPVGIHIVAWCDTPAAVERTLERALLREFDNRILFQMSATDSSNLIDSPAANKLGFYRALIFSEEQGTLEKFRPYAVPPATWLAAAGAQLRQKQSPTTLPGHPVLNP